jgi:hypothetical protein
MKNIIYVIDYKMGIYVYKGIEYILSPALKYGRTNSEQINVLAKYLKIKNKKFCVEFCGRSGLFENVKKTILITPY